MFKFSSNLVVPFSFLALIVLFTIPTANAQSDSLAFGDRERIDSGLLGKIYVIPDTTRVMPDFENMKAAGVLYTNKIDIAERQWNTGFPGLPDRKEWFGIVYTGYFTVKKPGTYIFRLLSDDGARLFIDKKPVIDNDGIHGPGSKLGTVALNTDRHFLRLEYFQGPRTELALQLFSTFGNETEQVFPGNNFSLTTPVLKKTSFKTYLVYAGGFVLLFFVLWIVVKRKRKRIPDRIHE